MINSRGLHFDLHVFFKYLINFCNFKNSTITKLPVRLSDEINHSKAIETMFSLNYTDKTPTKYL
jgi:hypothetical protein